MAELICSNCGKKLVSKIRDPDKECLLLPNKVSQCSIGLSVEQTILIFSQMATHRMRLFISKLELPPGAKTLIGMGFNGVAAAKEQWKVDKLLPKLKSIKNDFEEIEKIISEH